MPIYDYRCDCGLRFERLMGRDAAAPACPECGGATRKVPSRPALHGTADVGLSREQMPQTWRGTYHGDREYVTAMQRKWEQRQRLEDKHPELAGDTRPVAAHEGRYEQVPLRAGEPMITPAAEPSGSSGSSHGHGHGHGHSHGGGSKETT
ncbi:FmdB family zinc ribbon protein [Actinomycetospora sp. TBRC 11914]|uniref:FmdB family zinc ribbon protein n=1 Tax=Actinomycetospora sp. TBRC 11914 TaxID=2729387 RepID=UPI00145D04BA|nr:zinc ribbon domain-containing protein [Actinomycetospora sp. TBRC 11914]NMO90195.1 zinc ribbon domain-containing protein [Actinomycetospora sp. TBRC 11914]